MVDRLEEGSASVVQGFRKHLNDPMLVFVGQLQGDGP